MIKPVYKTKNTPPMFTIRKFTGIDVSSTYGEISNSASPDMMNCVLDELGKLDKRTGYKKVFEVSLGAGKINGLFLFRRKDGTAERIVAHGTKLYKWYEDSAPIEFYSGIANNEVKAFVMNDKMYFLDGVHYLEYDGTTVKEPTPYIPTLALTKSPSGGGTPFEQWNLLGSGFKDSYSADGTSNKYKLSLENLDATICKAWVDNVEKVETTDFTVNRTTGEVTFIVIPPAGTDNVVIQAYKTITGYADRVKKSTFFTLYGGNNDTRVFLSGNLDDYNAIMPSGVYDPTYFPENKYIQVGSNNEKVMGFTLHYDSMIIHKEFSKWSMDYTDTGTDIIFTVKPVNDAIGCIASNSIQLIDNNPVALTKTGVYVLTGGTVRDERNVQHISKKVDNRLLKEPNLNKAISIDYNGKYALLVNNTVYIWDYRQADEEGNQVWYLWDNVPSNCFIEIDGYLYFGSKTEGMLYRFMKKEEDFPWQDDGQAIDAYWYSKLLSFDASFLKKNIEKIFVSLKPDIHTSVDMSYKTEKQELTYSLTARMDQFNLNYFDFDKFSFVASDITQENTSKIKAKKVIYMQLKLQNNKLHESMGILALNLKYTYGGEVK